MWDEISKYKGFFCIFQQTNISFTFFKMRFRFPCEFQNLGISFQYALHKGLRFKGQKEFLVIWSFHNTGYKKVMQ